MITRFNFQHSTPLRLIQSFHQCCSARIYWSKKVNSKYDIIIGIFQFPVSARPPAGGRWRHWEASYSTKLSSRVKAISSHPYRAHVIYQLSPGSSGLHCTKRNDDQHTSSRTWVSTRAQPPPRNLHYKKDLVSSPVWWEAETNIAHPYKMSNKKRTP